MLSVGKPRRQQGVSLDKEMLYWIFPAVNSPPIFYRTTWF
jgi:hypothetical protein